MVNAETRSPGLCRTNMDRYRSREQKPVVWRWLARMQPDSKWRELPRSMTEKEAAAWSRARGRDIERIEGTAEERNAD